MNVVIVGSGNVGSVLGRKINDSGHKVLQVLSRNIEHAAKLASLLDAAAGDYKTGIDPSADIYIFCVADTALFEMEKYFSLGDKLVVHTAGSVAKDVLQNVSANCGVLYPLQSLRKEMTAIPEIPFMVDAVSEPGMDKLNAFAASLSHRVCRINDERRAKLHAAAVVVSNFVNHLYNLTWDFCEKEEIDFKMLEPLIFETANRLRDNDPGNLQTGPAIRNDVYTLQKHLQLLSAHPRLKYLYVKLTDSIMNA